MVEEVKSEATSLATDVETAKSPPKLKSRSRGKDSSLPIKRSCAACSSVYGTECVYDPNSDHRRKGVYKKDIDNLKTRNSTLQTLIQAILNYPEDEVPALVRQIRTCESLDDVAENIITKENGLAEADREDDALYAMADGQSGNRIFENELSGKMGELRLENGCRRFIGGTSNLILLSSEDGDDWFSGAANADQDEQPDAATAIASWTTTTSDVGLIIHLMTMYFTWHYPYFTTLSRNLFYRDFLKGMPPQGHRQKIAYCTPLLVNAMLALGCHFTSHPEARAEPDDLTTAGDHFFREAKRLILENDEHEKPRLTTVQALALMSVREAGCGREAKGWVYSGMSFRMACDLGLNIDSGSPTLDEQEIDARRMTFWGCFLFDKCWSNYMGRIPQLPNSIVTVPKAVVFPVEDSEIWSPYTDSGAGEANSQPARTRAVALQISLLCEISSDLILFFYNPTQMERPVGKTVELKKLSEIHTKLEAWRKNLPKEMGPEPKETPLPQVLLMHMFSHLLFIHLYRPFLKYNQSSSPLPSHVSPRKFCTQAASSISKLLRTYKSLYGLRQICNVAVYIAHSACTIHILNLPDKNAKRDVIHGLRHLEEIAEGWLCARRTLGILSLLSKRWKVELPEEADGVLSLADEKWGQFNPGEIPEMKSNPSSPRSSASRSPALSANPLREQKPYPAESQVGFMNCAVAHEPSTPNMEYNITPQRRQVMEACAPYSPVQPQPHVPTKETPTPRSFQDSPRSITGSTHSASPSALLGGIENLVQESQDWWLRDQSALAFGFDNWGMIESDPSMITSSGVGAVSYVGTPGNTNTRNAPDGTTDGWYM
ncbi:MAG: hypothetical protein M1840_007042 [Geoglossum simile]|nr:MAG: hypothetical protein M1840_007042 [Geoglossum simile]